MKKWMPVSESEGIEDFEERAGLLIPRFKQGEDELWAQKKMGREFWFY
jgi:hypothetical protein